MKQIGIKKRTKLYAAEEVDKVDNFSCDKHFMAFLEAIPDAVFFKDGDGRWLFTNEPAKQLFQLHNLPWEGKTEMELADLQPPFRTAHEECLASDEKTWRCGHLLVGEEIIVGEDDRSRIIETHKVPIFSKDGRRQGLAIIARDITERKAEHTRLQQMALYDSLSGLANRRLLESHLEQSMARAQRSQRLLAVCLLDLDNFKPVNDTYGHDAGDEVLVEIGRRLTEVVRKADFVARWGGDEFVLLIEDLTNLLGLSQVLTKVGKTIAEPVRLSNGQTVEVGVSMGVCIYPFGEEETCAPLLRQADQALYESKAHKTDRKRFWVLSGEDARKRVQTPAQRHMDEGRVEVWYQPILDHRSCRIIGMEALARIRDEDGRLIVPGEFLPQLAASDIFSLSCRVLSQAVTDLAVLDTQRDNALALWVSVNVDPNSIDIRFVNFLQEILSQRAVDPARITLEILEGADFLELNATLEVLLRLKSLGVRLALDDVGSAYSSLLRLKDLPVDEIKLDQSFIRTLGERPQDLHFVAAVQDLASGLGVDLVVEGVETDEILDAMIVMDVGLIQGYGIARPMPIGELLDFLSHPPIESRLHPTCLLGLYAAHLIRHNTLKKAIRQNPTLVNRALLSDASTCPISEYLCHLGFKGDSTLDNLHREYHRAIAMSDDLFIPSRRGNSWLNIERTTDNLLEAILAERMV
ncbi:putative bifunctional diguanylate cyclase/phosphodiesterase, partial [Acidithiobacillus ferriphilus]|uniref:putative bifunctional diguanylate cyclase/phosphodiesterase n=1 Tax=Acidithiobacillus ferriphilus TaxID=1689834 RepID=UPI002DB840EF